jgi:hypothetical protein
MDQQSSTLLTFFNRRRKSATERGFFVEEGHKEVLFCFFYPRPLWSLFFFVVFIPFFFPMFFSQIDPG